MKPVLALVGRPNVGKSTLFNRLTKSRDAIVADYAGLTRDRHYGQGKQGKYEYIVIDTGGFEPTAESGIYKEMAKQTRQAVAEADVVLFVLDALASLGGWSVDDLGFKAKAAWRICVVRVALGSDYDTVASCGAYIRVSACALVECTRASVASFSATR